MSDVTLTIRGGGRSRQADLNPDGAVIGRDPACDVVIASPEISRRHAKIFQTSSGQWTIKDLGSSNGTFVNGGRVESCPISPGDIIEIGPVHLSLGQEPERQTAAAPPSQLPKIIVEDFGTEVFYSRPRIEECTEQPCAERLKTVRQRLSELAGQDAIYREVCRVLAQDRTAAAAIFRVSTKDELTLEAPDVRAYHFGGASGQADANGNHSWYPSHHGFRVSHHLLEKVRAGGHPLMTKTIYSCDTEVTISLIDEHSPRALICVPLGTREDATDLLYVDVPMDDRGGPSPEEMFAFVQAVAQQIQEATA